MEREKDQYALFKAACLQNVSEQLELRLKHSNKPEYVVSTSAMVAFKTLSKPTELLQLMIMKNEVFITYRYCDNGI